MVGLLWQLLVRQSRHGVLHPNLQLLLRTLCSSSFSTTCLSTSSTLLSALLLLLIRLLLLLIRLLLLLLERGGLIANRFNRAKLVSLLLVFGPRSAVGFP